MPVIANAEGSDQANLSWLGGSDVGSDYDACMGDVGTVQGPTYSKLVDKKIAGMPLRGDGATVNVASKAVKADETTVTLGDGQIVYGYKVGAAVLSTECSWTFVEATTVDTTEHAATFTANVGDILVLVVYSENCTTNPTPTPTPTATPTPTPTPSATTEPTVGTYEVRYKKNGGKGSYYKDVVAVDEAYTIQACKYVRVGYNFVTWNLNADGSHKKDFYVGSVWTKIKGAGKVVPLYAQWTPRTYTVRFGKNGGKGTMADMTGLAYDSTYKLSANTFTRSGYTFVGWNTKKDGSGVSYKNKASIANLTAVDGKTIILYAQWKKN